MATQNVESLTREALAAVFTNCGTLISFRVSGADAVRLREEFTMLSPGAYIQDLPDHQAYVRTLTCKDGVCEPADPQVIATYPPFRRAGDAEWRSRIVRSSNERYTRPRAQVDAEIARFLMRAEPEG